MKKLAILGLTFLASTHVACNLQPHNFGVVEEEKLYRSAEPDEKFLKKLIVKYQLKSIVVLTRKVSESEQRIAAENNIRIFHLPMRPSREPSEELIRSFLEIIRNPENQPILVHCKAGADRTGLLVAVRRIEIDRWSLEKAKNEMVYYWHTPIFHPTIQNYLQKRYDPK